jgi:DNA-binding response OmpR family regulator
MLTKVIQAAAVTNPIASSVGIDSFIVKPYDKKELIDKIKSLVGE